MEGSVELVPRRKDEIMFLGLIFTIAVTAALIGAVADFMAQR